MSIVFKNHFTVTHIPYPMVLSIQKPFHCDQYFVSDQCGCLVEMLSHLKSRRTVTKWTPIFANIFVIWIVCRTNIWFDLMSWHI